ncbi:MAG: 1-deoxy-D-xylulose-5-phosphate synthase [Firmicutes bacterium]|nr:1-deoxy-D-xylulose-5-phosphate synthase [Bacillota bacterium]
MYVERVNTPADLKGLSVDQLQALCIEIREFLVESVMSTGGHFGSNLGVVELTVALHYVFDSPRDKLVWDVGHQAYVHKMLTERREAFSSLRQFKGLAGFLKRNESEHDAFGAGHASTSISAALGMAIARDLKGEAHHVSAIIGDGAMTGGMSFEALNHAGHLGKRIVVVLNDNEMSISPNVGAFSKYLTRLRTDPKYERVKLELDALMRRIPGIGDRVAMLAERARDSLRNFLVAGALFEELGFTYIGPVDGHDLPTLIEMLSIAKEKNGPVLLHVVTEKGKGYASAEAAQDKLHSVSSSAVTVKKPTAPTYTSVFASTLTELARNDPRIVAITAAMDTGTGLNKFAEVFPHRCFDVGIAEQHATTLAAGLASAGMRPVFAVYSTFLQRAYDQVIHDVCIQNLPVTFAIDRAGLVGPDGETHQGAFDVAYLRTVPNMTIMAPKDERELQNMLYTALSLDGPAAVRYPRDNGVGVALAAECELLPVGRAEIVREGRDVAILALGTLVAVAENAALMLAEQGISAQVVNMRFAKPIDAELLETLAKIQIPIVTVEEGAVHGGFGSAVLEWFAVHARQMTVVPLGLPDHFVEHGSRPELLHLVGLTAQGVADAALTALSRPAIAREKRRARTS